MKHKTLKDAVVAWDMMRKRPAVTAAEIAAKADSFYPPEQREKDLESIYAQIAQLGEIVSSHIENGGINP